MSSLKRNKKPSWYLKDLEELSDDDSASVEETGAEDPLGYLVTSLGLADDLAEEISVETTPMTPSRKRSLSSSPRCSQPRVHSTLSSRSKTLKKGGPRAQASRKQLEDCEWSPNLQVNAKSTVPRPLKKEPGTKNAKKRKVTKQTHFNNSLTALNVADILFGGDVSALDFRWASMASFEPQPESYLPTNQGPTFKPTNPYEAFRFFWNEDIMQQIATRTNEFAAGITSEAFQQDWYDTNEHEIFMLFSFWMMLGIIRMPSIRSCYSKHPMLDVGSFKKLMNQSRLWNLNRALNFNDPSLETSQSSEIFLIEPVIEHLNTKFKEAYVPSQNIAIDESVTLWKGEDLPFKQRIKKKESGIKTLDLCESATGYLWSFIVYAGNKKTTPSHLVINQSTQTVLNLIQPLLNQGYRVFMDSKFTSPILARFLKWNRTDCVGAIDKTCQNVPEIIQMAELPLTNYIAAQASDVMVIAYRNITVISTCHGDETELNISNKFYIPSVIKDYKKNIGGVDLKEHSLEPYEIERKRCAQWHKKLFKRFLNVSIHNASVIFSASTGHKVDQMQFRLALVSDMVKKHSLLVPRVHKELRVSVQNPTEKRYAPADNHYVIKTDLRRLCQWCSTEGFSTRVRWKCEQCDVWLCVEGCFKSYHNRPLL